MKSHKMNCPSLELDKKFPRFSDGVQIWDFGFFHYKEKAKQEVMCVKIFHLCLKNLRGSTH